MAWAFDLLAEDLALTQRATVVGADVVNGVHRAVLKLCQRQLASVGLHD